MTRWVGVTAAVISRILGAITSTLTFGASLLVNGAIRATSAFNTDDGRYTMTSGPVLDLRGLTNGKIFQSDNSTLAAWFAAWFATGAPTTTASSSYSVGAQDADVIYNVAGTTTTVLPTASSFTGRELWVKTITANAVNSSASNVVPLVGGAAGTAILTATAGKWARLKSDGANWIIMAGN